MTLILESKPVAASIRRDLAAKMKLLDPPAKLAILQVGDRTESNAYINRKKAVGVEIKALVEHRRYESDITEADLIAEIQSINDDSLIHGLIVQLPLPEHLDPVKLTAAVAPEKDVDGLGPANLHRLWFNHRQSILPPVTRGILSLLDHYSITIAGKKVVIVGRSASVGKPTALAFLRRDATVTLCHRQTQNLADETKTADILVAAAGQPRFITAEYVSPHQTVIDVGINLLSGHKLEEEISGRRLIGDVDFEKVKDKVAAISPVPGGVGPMTVASLFENLLSVYKKTPGVQSRGMGAGLTSQK